MSFTLCKVIPGNSLYHEAATTTMTVGVMFWVSEAFPWLFHNVLHCCLSYLPKQMWVNSSIFVPLDGEIFLWKVFDLYRWATARFSHGRRCLFLGLHSFNPWWRILTFLHSAYPGVAKSWSLWQTLAISLSVLAKSWPISFHRRW